MYKIYKINYQNSLFLQSGGKKQYVYNNSKYYSWPLPIGKRIHVRKLEDNKLYTGTIKNHIYNKTASVIKLDANNEKYIDLRLSKKKEFNKGKGHLLLLPGDRWALEKKPISTGGSDHDEDEDEDEDEYTEIPTATPVPLPKSKNIASHRADANKHKLVVKEEKFNKDSDGKVLFTRIENTIPSGSNLWNLTFKSNENNIIKEHYIPAMESTRNIYFKEADIDILITNRQEIFTSLDKGKQNELRKNLESWKPIGYDKKLVVNKSVAVDNLIRNNASDQTNEGNKIIEWIKETFITSFGKDLIAKINKGYVYITRRGVKVTDIITEKLVPRLNHWKEQQLNKPINYNLLKYPIFQTKAQLLLKQNLEEKIEAEEILSQEYCIALQPSYMYQIWTLKRLLMIWYADKDIEPHIRKIKVLINQFRANPNKEYNNFNKNPQNGGILGSILVYPKYGRVSTRIVLSKLQYYFSLYVDESSKLRHQDIEWKNSVPTFFIKQNSLLYWTNGSIELKNYVNYSKSLKSQSISKTSAVFTNDMTEFIQGKPVPSLG